MSDDLKEEIKEILADIRKLDVRLSYVEGYLKGLAKDRGSLCEKTIKPTSPPETCRCNSLKKDLCNPA